MNLAGTRDNGIWQNIFGDYRTGRSGILTNRDAAEDGCIGTIEHLFLQLFHYFQSSSFVGCHRHWSLLGKGRL